MATRICILVGLAVAAAAQEPVAPTPAQVGGPRGENSSDYNITQSWELGYRWAMPGGDLGMYRSVDNYHDGARLLGSSFAIRSRDGHGRLFDEILLNTLGLGGDPYQSAMLHAEKNGLYRYDLLWRLDDYYNPALTVTGNYGLGIAGAVPLLATQGLHSMDTERRMQDHELTLLPQSRIRFHLGYGRNTEDGPALSTAQEFDPNGSGYPVFLDVKRHWNEYRLGAEFDFAGFRFTVTRRWDFFKDDTPYTAAAGAIGSATPGDQSVLNNFNRSAPIHGANPGWLGNLFTRRKRWSMDARLTYVSGKNDFLLDELALGTSQFGAAAARQIVAGGDAHRDDLAGNFTVQLFPTGRLTVTNGTSVLSNRMDGPSTYTELDNGLNTGATVYFRYLGVRMYTNATTVDFRLTPKIGFFAGYDYSDRPVRTVEGLTIPAFANSTENDVYQVSNHMNSARAGVRFRPWKPFSITLDAGIGRSNNPLTPVSEKNFHSIHGRAEYRTRRVQLSAGYREDYNLNAPSTLTPFDSHSRQYSAGGSWTARDWFSIDANYLKLHLDTTGGLAFFAGAGFRTQLQTGYVSYYLSNIHSGTLAAHIAVRRRADVYLGYSITKDTGDGRPAPAPAGITDPVAALLDSVQTFPLTYHAPMARLSVRISEKVRWNAGYQFYNYNQQFNLLGYYQNFHANTGYTSVLWSF